MRSSDDLLKANMERSESRYSKPAEGYPKRGVFSIAISNHTRGDPCTNMPQKCCVPRCKEKVNEEDGVKMSFHKFPEDRELFRHQRLAYQVKLKIWKLVVSFRM